MIERVIILGQSYFIFVFATTHFPWTFQEKNAIQLLHRQTTNKHLVNDDQNPEREVLVTIDKSHNLTNFDHLLTNISSV